jgi:hypothetical protein
MGCKYKVLHHFHCLLQFLYFQISYFCSITIARFNKGCGKNSSTNKRGLALKVVGAKPVPSNCHVLLVRMHKPPTYLSQDQNKKDSRLRFSTTAAINAAKPRIDSKEGNKDDNDNDDKEEQKNDGEDDDSGEDKQGVKKVGNPFSMDQGGGCQGWAR